MTSLESPREADIPFGTAAVRAIGKLSDQLLANLPGTLSGEDIEALHDMRVASRRLRAALRIFNEVFPKKALRRTESEVKSVTSALGGVRDLDVFIESLRNLAESDNLAIHTIIENESGKRETARLRMNDSLHATFDGGFRDMLSTLLSRAYLTEASDPPSRTTSFAGQAQRIATPKVADVLGLSRAVDNPLDSAGLHALRIAMKKLRYTVEPFAPFWGSELADKIANIKKLQEYLGQIHDCDVWIDLLKVYAHDPSYAYERNAVQRALDRLTESRHSSYLSLHDHWAAAIGDSFFDDLISLLGSLPGDNSSLQEVSTMDEEKTLQETQAEATASDAPQAKPATRRRTSTRRTAQKPEPEQPVAEVQKTDRTPVLVTADDIPAPKPASQHPGIVHLKLLIQTTSAKLSEMNVLTPKMSKQLKKLDSALDKAHRRLRYVRLKQAARAEKHLLDMRQNLSQLSDRDDISTKQMETIRKRPRSLRHKLSDIKKR